MTDETRADATLTEEPIADEPMSNEPMTDEPMTAEPPADVDDVIETEATEDTGDFDEPQAGEVESEEIDTVHVISLKDRKLVRSFKTPKGAGPDPVIMIGN